MDVVITQMVKMLQDHLETSHKMTPKLYCYECWMNKEYAISMEGMKWIICDNCGKHYHVMCAIFHEKNNLYLCDYCNNN